MVMISSLSGPAAAPEVVVAAPEAGAAAAVVGLAAGTLVGAPAPRAAAGTLGPQACSSVDAPSNTSPLRNSRRRLKKSDTNFSLRSAAHARIQHVAQGIPEQIDAQRRDKNGEPGEGR